MRKLITDRAVSIPSKLPKVGTLARGLKERPFLQEVFFGSGGEGDCVLLVVGVNEV